MSQGAPKLGWCWYGNPHTWLGSATAHPVRSAWRESAAARPFGRAAAPIRGRGRTGSRYARRG
ncbi:DUF5701 family protein [Micromonospora sp. NPDC007230]|uniref:DUF5701 family protein n=1 Tax=Micromonospora sp. NPDC007230 TaxID=3364237 RepID=UPI0036850907